MVLNLGGSQLNSTRLRNGFASCKFTKGDLLTISFLSLIMLCVFGIRFCSVEEPIICCLGIYELTWVGLNSTKEKACILQVEDSFLSFLSWLWRGNFKKKSICSHSFIITLFTFTFCSDHLLPAVLI